MAMLPRVLGRTARTLISNLDPRETRLNIWCGAGLLTP